MQEGINHSLNNEKFSRFQKTIDLVLDDLSRSADLYKPAYTLYEMKDEGENQRMVGSFNLVKSEISLTEQEFGLDGESIPAHEAAHLFLSRSNFKYLEHLVEAAKQHKKIKNIFENNESYNPKDLTSEYYDLSMLFMSSVIYEETIATYVGHSYGRGPKPTRINVEDDIEWVLGLAYYYVQTKTYELEEGKIFDDNELTQEVYNVRFISAQVGKRLGKYLHANSDRVNLNSLMNMDPKDFFVLLINSYDEDSVDYIGTEGFIEQLIRSINKDK